MKKDSRRKLSIISALTAAIMLTATVGCKGKTSVSPGGEEPTDTIRVEPLDLGSDFNPAYYPVKEKITQREGKIDVVIVFNGLQPGWRALAKEYERLHSGAVVVKLYEDNYSSATYKDALTYQITNKNTDWDIVQGNIVSSLINKYCINMYTYVNGRNAYAGNKTWSNVIEEDAYITDKTGTNTSTYIMNSESLLTAWFVNTVALRAAGEQGYTNKNGEAGNPVTWDDLINLCDCMQKAGYSNPLGISLTKDSIGEYTFSWLLRVYGDYYFRNEYEGIMKNKNYVYDPTSENPENDINYAIDYTWLFNKVLDESSEKYIGPKSAKFKEFIGQFDKMKSYLPAGTKQTTMEEMRNRFQTQTNGKSDPQIILDYSGSGLGFLSSETSNFKIDFFDYPQMVSEGNFVPQNTVTRDVGGNGGYLSIIDHDSAQDALNLDFMKFVMSPYGQTIYYDALSKTSVTPKGLTLVKNNLVKIPENWKAFFATDKISFTGLADNNEFVRNMILNLGGNKTLPDTRNELYMNYLAGKGGDAINTNTFSTRWATALLKGWNEYATAQKWNVNCYKYPGNGTQYGGN